MYIFFFTFLTFGHSENQMLCILYSVQYIILINLKPKCIIYLVENNLLIQEHKCEVV